MSKELSYKLLRISYSAMRITKSRPYSLTEPIGRDLYDFVEQYTEDLDLRYQMKEARAQGWDRYKSLQYINHRLNIGLI